MSTGCTTEVPHQMSSEVEGLGRGELGLRFRLKFGMYTLSFSEDPSTCMYTCVQAC